MIQREYVRGVERQMRPTNEDEQPTKIHAIDGAALLGAGRSC